MASTLTPQRLGGLAVLTVVSGILAGNIFATRGKRPVGIYKAVVQPEQFDRLAPMYDEAIEGQEKSLGLEKQRKSFMALADNVVLELACGTGRNSEYYLPEKVKRLILTDSSLEMLEQAKKKPIPVTDVEYKVLDAQDLSSFESSSIDTVVDTFGLCSFPNPELALKEIERVLRDDGKALLLEHGRAENSFFLNKWLDFRAAAHAAHWGCLANRDVLNLVRTSGLIVESVNVTQMGTAYEIVARKCTKSAS